MDTGESMQPQTQAKPAKKQSKWSPEEDARIIRLRGEGMKWEEISNHLPGRSSISCRLHYQNYLEKKSVWDEDKKNKLALVYERLKSQMWSKVAEELGVPWRAAEAMHWQLGETDMTRRAGSSPFVLAPTKPDTRDRVNAARRPISQPPVEHNGREFYSYGRPSYGAEVPPPMTAPYTAPHRRDAPVYPDSNTPDIRNAAASLPPQLVDRHSPPSLPPLHVDMHYKAASSLAPMYGGQGSPRPRGMLPGIAELTTGLDLYERDRRDPGRTSIGSEPRWDSMGNQNPLDRDQSLKRRASQPLTEEELSYRKPRR